MAPGMGHEITLCDKNFETDLDANRHGEIIVWSITLKESSRKRFSLNH